MSVKGVRGPEGHERHPEFAGEIPSCVKILTPKDEREFADFIAKIVEAAQRAVTTPR